MNNYRVDYKTTNAESIRELTKEFDIVYIISIPKCVDHSIYFCECIPFTTDAPQFVYEYKIGYIDDDIVKNTYTMQIKRNVCKQ